jgi:uncharacterized FlgJ-related protein
MFYKFDKNTLLWKKDVKKIRVALSTIIILMISSFILGRFVRFKPLDDYEKELVIISLENEKNKFTEDKFVEELKRLNVKYPYIVMAQAIAETGHYKSDIFKENHNLFGMKQANLRINTAKGTQNGHAYYDNWQQSIYDYAFYQCRYLGNIKNESEYFLYLSSVYAEAGNGYVDLLKQIIQKENLKEKFK